MDAGLKTYRDAAAKEMRDRLIVNNLEFVKHILAKLIVGFPNFIDKENLEAAGILGLVEAANRYSSTQGVQFKTFAYQRIRGAILDELRRNCPLPQRVMNQWSLIKSVIQKESGPASTQQIAERSGLTLAEIEECLVAIRMVAPETWTDEISAPRFDTGQAADAVIEKERETILANAIEKLSDQQRAVVTLYYVDDLTLKQIGETLGVSESRVSRILAKSELLLKQYVQQDPQPGQA